MEEDPQNVTTDDDLPWYRGPKDAQPFIFAKLISSDDRGMPPFHMTASFPWDTSSLHTLWDGDNAEDTRLVPKWLDAVENWKGTIAAGSTGALYIFPGFLSKKPFRVKLARADWEPLVVFSASSVLFILDVRTKKIVGSIRGHGGDITSIAVHPVHPFIFCTTSKDMTTRLYDISYSARQKPDNPPWPPCTKPSLAGPAFGLQMTGSEGAGMGRCVAVFVGGRSGGHQGAVFCAAFHPTYPLLATCGMDRAVKIWHMPSYEPQGFAREDKPLFSTSLVHKARALSISWLQDDILISHSAPALMRRNNSSEDLYDEEGTVVIWQWLGFHRFFPPGKQPQRVLRPCVGDYLDSESFKILSSYSLPMATRRLCVYRSPTHDPIILIPTGTSIRITNIVHFKPRDPPPFPYDDLSGMAKRMRLDEASGEAEDNQPRYPPGAPARPLLDDVPGWEISAEDGKAICPDLPSIDGCEVAFGGLAVVAVGAKGTLFFWRLKLPSNTDENTAASS